MKTKCLYFIVVVEVCSLHILTLLAFLFNHIYERSVEEEEGIACLLFLISSFSFPSAP
jgi:hypothetical protein